MAPIVNCAVVATLAIWRSGTPIVTVRSLAVLLAGVLSPPPETRATFVKLPGASVGTATVSVIGAAALDAARPPESVQLTTWPLTVHVQPVPLASVGTIGAGTVSRTTIGALVVPALPTLLTVSV